MISWELDAVEQWLKTLLVAAAGIADVFTSHRAGRGKSVFVVFTFVDGPGDVTGQGAGNRLLARPSYQIEVVTDGPPTDASEAMVTAISTRLKDGPWPEDIGGGVQVTMERRGTISRTTPGATAEQFYTHRGGTYQLWVA